MKTKISIIGATFVACFLSIVICGLSEHSQYAHADSSDTVQTPENDDWIVLDPSIIQNDNFLSMSSGAMSSIGSTVIKPETDKVEKPEDETTSEDVIDTEENTEDIEDTEEINKGYYCEWGDFYLTQKEYELLLTTVFCESGGEGSDTQYMVTLAILNRLVDSKFPDTLHDVVYAKNAFSVTRWKDFENRGWTAKVEASVQKALASNPHPKDMFYFRTGHYHSWAKDYKKVGKVYFSTRK